jgi:hypothetical protein
LLRQDDGLQNVAGAGWTDELSPKPGLRPLNSRASGGQMPNDSRVEWLRSSRRTKKASGFHGET